MAARGRTTPAVAVLAQASRLFCGDSDGRTVKRQRSAYAGVRRFSVDLLLELAAWRRTARAALEE